jgi:hypothetical protein
MLVSAVRRDELSFRHAFFRFCFVFSGIRGTGVINIPMRKSSAVAKNFPPPHSTRKRAIVKEDEQLYLVRQPGNGATHGFRHHRPKERREEVPVNM